MVSVWGSCRGLVGHYGKAVQRHLLKGGGGTVRPLRASQHFFRMLGATRGKSPSVSFCQIVTLKLNGLKTPAVDLTHHFVG